MQIYVDVLVAINYFVSYLMLQACGRISGLPLGRRSSVMGALVGALSSLTVFLPLQGFGWGLLCRAVTGLAMLLAAWPGRSRADYLRLLLILLSVSFLFAGAVAAWCFLFPKSPVYLIGPTLYFHLSPAVLLFTVTAAYLLLGFTQRLRSRRRSQSLIYEAEVTHRGKTAFLRLMMDTGNTLTEPFSGLPVAVCSLPALVHLLTPEETAWLESGAIAEPLPPGMRPVVYHAVGGGGLLGAFRPDSFCLRYEGESRDCALWVAVSPGRMPGCDGVFNPAMLELRI